MQKTSYETRICDWSSDVCSSDLDPVFGRPGIHPFQHLSEVILVPAAAHDDEDVLELGTLDAMLRRERRVAVDEGVHGDELRIGHLAELPQLGQLGRGSCRERVGQYV